MLPLELIADSEPRARADRLLEEVGLAERAHHYPRQLSGGEQQRVALARAFANRPALLLADEPTGNLDRDNGTKVLALIDRLRRDSQTTLVIVTHDPAAARIASRQAQLIDGRLALA
jgi:putative ABC transport system ATP-binding protein